VGGNGVTKHVAATGIKKRGGGRRFQLRGVPGARDKRSRIEIKLSILRS